MDIVESIAWEAGRIERRVDPVAGSVYARGRVKTPFVLRGAAKVVGLRRGLDAPLAAEWQDELEQVEAAVNLAAAGAASTPGSRAHALAELTRTRARYTRFLSAHSRGLEATGVSAAAVSETRRALNRVIETVDFYSASTLNDAGEIAAFWEELAADLALLIGVRTRWLALMAASPPDRWRSRLWWKQFLPVTRRQYVLYLRELGGEAVELRRGGDRVGLRVRRRDVTETTSDEVQKHVLRGDLHSAAGRLRNALWRR